jgi:hypothetical protein
MGAGVGERGLDAIAVDGEGLVGVLLDDGEQVPQQAALERRELRVLHRGVDMAGVNVAGM